MIIIMKSIYGVVQTAEFTVNGKKRHGQEFQRENTTNVKYRLKADIDGRPLEIIMWF
jgi:hypothetical protein